MAVGNRLLICVLAGVILAGLGAAFALDWSGRRGDALFMALATTALGVLCPSPLRQDSPSAATEKEGE